MVDNGSSSDGESSSEGSSGEYWEENSNYASFLASASLEKDEPKSKRRNKRKRDQEKVNVKESEDDESDFDEDKARLTAKSTSNWKMTDVSKLPVKSGNGILLPSSLNEEERMNSRPGYFSLVKSKEEKELENETKKQKKLDDDDDEEMNDVSKVNKNKKKDLEEAKPKEKLTAAQLLFRREEKKKEIAKLAEDILGDPEAGVTQQKSLGGGSSCRLLFDIASSDQDSSLRKLAILSLVAVYKDILPGYRIRLEAEKEKGVVLTKQVRSLRKFERGLLENYQMFLQLLYLIVTQHLGSLSKTHKFTKRELENKVESSRKKSSSGYSLSLIAIRGMCTLLVSKPHFNFRENLIANIIPRMNSPIPEIREQCCACIRTVLQTDFSGDSTLEVIVYLAKIIKKENGGAFNTVHPQVLEVLMGCRLNADLKDAQRKEKVLEERKQRKKKKKSGDEVSKHLQEAEATVSEYHKHAKQLESLRELFVMYLRVLKRAPQSAIMPPVLRGIAKFVHLVNLDIAQALITVLTNLVKSDALPVETGLQSIHTIALILRGPGSELMVDEQEFIAYLYRLLMKLGIATPDRDKHILLTIRCIEAIFLGRKQYQQSRVAALVTRLCVLANMVSQHSTIALISCVRQLMFRYPSVCKPLLDSEKEQGEGGNSLALGLPPPDDANMDPVMLTLDSPVLWPLAQLRFHYHPYVREFVQKALEMKPLLPSDRPPKVYSAYNPYRDGGFNPAPSSKLETNTKNVNKKKKPFFKKKK